MKEQNRNGVKAVFMILSGLALLSALYHGVAYEQNINGMVTQIKYITYGILFMITALVFKK